MSVKSIATPVQPLRIKRRAERRFRSVKSRHVLLALSVSVLLFILFSAVAPGWMASHSPTEMSESILASPSAGHLLGTDQYGRDIYSLLVYGSRQSLLIGVGSVLIGGLLGSVLGLTAGYRGGWLDSLIMRFVDMMMTIPGILFAILISATLGPSLKNMILAVGLSTFPGYARMMRSQVLSIKSAPFIDAASTIGASHFMILRRHIVPNCLPPLIVMATIGTGTAVLISTGLSFLGLGVIREIPDWGYLLSLGRSYISVAWWISLFPGIFISFLVISINLLGDELRNLLEPRSRR
ncbi:peptide/nickel transport system permease protein [Paenibacillus cellulosilyticus]|uniref:Peptide/nickel transport system permease protein n=1 Tax=Paenibacillus cellulosilyticus TaxID=375489 RepID=A0A2V2YTP2_9BACL|nr:ABC transporter permease [Paenibacillus cellulosilyticus]PWW02785.1 peptide/nickel transport system permease protein [Paenibacillus cellulosilyticus]QKS45708.1 ABC transporter permease [Paenibacillus cellulosilyticus]